MHNKFYRIEFILIILVVQIYTLQLTWNTSYLSYNIARGIKLVNYIEDGQTSKEGNI
jgi:hypothetical protein